MKTMLLTLDTFCTLQELEKLLSEAKRVDDSLTQRWENDSPDENGEYVGISDMAAAGNLVSKYEKAVDLVKGMMNAQLELERLLG